ncbi:MAG: amino acid racemase [Pseudobacteriovorax sp.]|nr:amino acid racemase [Pseudobacteriovorax sp.]
MLKQEKQIGLIGGISWHSTIEYIREINELAAKQQRPYASARMIVSCLDFADLVELQQARNSDAINKLFSQEIDKLRNSGAEIIALASNTAHIYLQQPHLNPNIVTIYDGLVAALFESNLKKVGLLGTKYVMRDGPYVASLKERGIDVVLPPESIATRVNQAIFKQLVKGQFTQELKDEFLSYIKEYQDLGVDAVILACTEIPMLMKGASAPIPLLNSVELHARAIWQASI